MNLKNMKILYVFSFVLLGLIILSPTFFTLFPIPKGEGFSELWLLDSNHLIVTESLEVILNRQYSMFLGVRNQMFDLQYYRLYVKLLNQDEALQEMVIMAPISSEPIFEYRFVLSNNETWNENFTFAFKDVSFEEENIRKISVLSINNNDIDMDKILVKDEDSGKFYCKLVFELWIYNSTASIFQYHNHFIDFWITLENQL